MPLASRTIISPMIEYKSMSFAFFTLEGSPPDDKNKKPPISAIIGKIDIPKIKIKFIILSIISAMVLQLGLAGGQIGLMIVTAWIVKGKIILKMERTIIIFKTEDRMMLLYFTIT